MSGLKLCLLGNAGTLVCWCSIAVPLRSQRPTRVACRASGASFFENHLSQMAGGYFETGFKSPAEMRRVVETPLVGDFSDAFVGHGRVHG